jgi:Fanconi anemia group M protein
LEASIIDGRLFEQAAKLCETYPSPVIGVVGKKFERLNPRALEGAIVSLLVDYRLPVMFFETEEKLADFIYAIAFREQLGDKRVASLQTAKKPAKLSSLQQFIVESLPGIGPTTAKTLLQHFGTVENVFTADEDELEAVEGIGEKSSRTIRRLLNAAYASK